MVGVINDKENDGVQSPFKGGASGGRSVVEGMFKGAGWLSLIALAAGASLTFVPDKTWDSFPEALAPVRAKLATVGLAPEKYRPKDSQGEFKLAETTPQDRYEGALEREKSFSTDLEPRSHVRIPGSESVSPADAPARVSPVRDRFANPAEDEPIVSEPPKSATPTPPDDLFNDPLFNSEPDPVALSDSTPAPGVPSAAPNAPVPSSFSDANALLGETTAPIDANPSVVPTNPAQNAAPAPNQFATDGGAVSFPTIPTTPAPNPTQNVAPTTPAPAFAENVSSQNVAPGAQSAVASETATLGVAPYPIGTQTPPETAPTQPEPQQPQAVFVDPQTTPQPLAQEQTPTTLQGTPATQAAVPTPDAQTPRVPAECLVGATCSTLLAQGDVNGALNAALQSAQNLQSADQVVEVFVTLDKLRPYYFRPEHAATLARINKALDLLSYDVVYNREIGILEPLYQTKPGETVATLAREWDVTPETVAAINCLEIPVDSPLPPGTTLKVVRGPVTAEVSASRKELLLRFNNLYAGRFPCGVPTEAARTRGEYVVENKIQNPSCKAVDLQGAELVIEGGAADNPLGSCWIGLNGGYGFQGTNRPELIGADVPERSGFVFSNLHISQLDIMTPVGATVKFVD